MSEQVELLKRARPACLPNITESAPALSPSNILLPAVLPSLTPPWPFYITRAPANKKFIFQYPCGRCRAMFDHANLSPPDGFISTINSSHKCDCGSYAWCLCQCNKYCCASCFEKADDVFLGTLQQSSCDFHPFSFRNIPLLVDVNYHTRHSTEPVDPQIPFDFSLFVPEESPFITIQLNMPWPSLRISRSNITTLPPSTWPKNCPNTHSAWPPYEAARAAKEHAALIAIQNTSFSENNARAYSIESRRLEFEDDCGVELPLLRNVHPHDHLLFTLRCSHLPPSPLTCQSFSSFRKDAMACAVDLPSMASWPALVPSAVFPWCCGECRSLRDACFRQPVTLLLSPAYCACRERARIFCPCCNVQYCYACFCIIDGFFLASFKTTRSAKDIRNLRNIQLPSLAPNATCLPINIPDSQETGDECESSSISQTSYQELLVESRKGPVSNAFMRLFNIPQAIELTNGYATNEFVVADSEVDSSLDTSSNSDISWVPSCHNICNECGQQLPTSQISCSATEPTLVSAASFIKTSPYTTLLPAAPHSAGHPPALLSITPLNYAPRTFIPSPIRPLPPLPSLDFKRTDPPIVPTPLQATPLFAAPLPVAPLLVAPLFCTQLPTLPPVAPLLAAPFIDTQLPSLLPVAPLLAVPLIGAQFPALPPTAPLFAAPFVGAQSLALLPAAPPFAAPLICAQLTALPPAALLIGIHPNPGPPPTLASTTSDSIRLASLTPAAYGIPQGSLFSPLFFITSTLHIAVASAHSKHFPNTRATILSPPLGHIPAAPLIGIHSNPGPIMTPPPLTTTPTPSTRLSTRASIPGPLFRNFDHNALTPLSPLRALSSLRNSIPMPLQPFTRPPANNCTSSLEAVIPAPDSADLAARQSFMHFICAEHSFPIASCVLPTAEQSLISTDSASANIAALEQSLRNPFPFSQSLALQTQFPLTLAHPFSIGPSPPPYLSFRFDCTGFTDGGAKNHSGSWAVLARSRSGSSLLVGFINNATNNLAELTAFLAFLRYAKSNQFLRILITSDSEIAVNFLKGHSRIDAQNLAEIISEIVSLLPSFQAVYVSHVKAHLDILSENAIADALCTWALSSKCSMNSLRLNNSASNLIPVLRRLNRSLPLSITEHACPLCLKKHSHAENSCPLFTFTSFYSARQIFPPCEACLSCEHLVSSCALMALPKRIPCPSLLIPAAALDPSYFGPMPDLLAMDFDSICFPKKQSHTQFLDFWITIWSKLSSAATIAEADAAGRAAEAWSKHFRIDGFCIRPHRPLCGAAVNHDGSNLHPIITNADAELAKRAMRAARLGPDARVADVSKALRKGANMYLSDSNIHQLSLLYPAANSDTIPTVFDSPPLACFSANRVSVARSILSRSPNSHPGKLGISFGILQLFCHLTFKKESANNPDPRWSLFCTLISHIMSGNAKSLSPMFHNVVGIFFDKNFEKPSAAISLRNIGVEESLVRVASALVFHEVIQDASKKGCLSCWELGCGVRNGAEIFGRIAAVAADNNMMVSVFDVEKAFNNLQRSDIKDAVMNFNNPLLSSFISFMFSSDPTVTFKDPNRQVSFTLVQGILQGNPLSTFLFSLTICWILKPFRLRYPNSLTPSFVDDLQLIAKPSLDYAPMLHSFISLFSSHKLRFDLSNSAKSSAFSVFPPSPLLAAAISALGLRCQQAGIAPCKIPFGDPNYMANHISKQQDKLVLRTQSFKALWPALLKLKPSLKHSRIGVHEAFLNLLRLSLLSMATYTLRTVSPQFCAPYASIASKLILQLIELVFPPCLHNIGNQLPFGPAISFPALTDISREILQLPLSLGGLSLRLPDSICAIAYSASCGESLHYLQAVGARLGFSFNISSLQGLAEARISVALQLNGYRSRKPDDEIIFERSSLTDPTPLQENLTSLLNQALIVRISAALKGHSVYLLAFLARVDKAQNHCSWPFNPVARRNFKIAALADEDFSRAIQIATLRPITPPRSCDCGAVIDPVGLHFLFCKFVHFGYLHDCVKTAIAATLKSFQPFDLAPLSILMEVKVSRFYPLRDPLLPEGPEILADIAASILDTVQQMCVLADVSSVLARGSGKPNDFHDQMRARSKAKIHKYRKYNIPHHLFYPITVGRTNVLSLDAISFCDFMAKFFPSIPKASDFLRAAISRAIVVGAARTLNTAIKRSQLAAFNALSFSGVPKSAACTLFRPVSLPSDGEVRLRAAHQSAPDDARLPPAVPVPSTRRLRCFR